MYAIAVSSTFTRAQIELPAGLKLTMQDFREGWNFVENDDARRLEKTARVEKREVSKGA